MSGISERKEWMGVRSIDAFKWIQDGTWTYSDFDSLDQSVLLDSISIELAIAEIYRNIEF